MKKIKSIAVLLIILVILFANTKLSFASESSYIWSTLETSTEPTSENSATEQKTKSEETKETEVKKGSGFTIIVEPLPFLGAPDNKRCVWMGASLK